MTAYIQIYRWPMYWSFSFRKHLYFPSFSQQYKIFVEERGQSPITIFQNTMFFLFFFTKNCSFNLSKAVTGREERNRRHLIFCILVEMMRNDRLSLRHLIWPELRKILRQQYPDYNFFSETSNYHVHSNNLWNKWNWFAFHLIGYLFASARDEIVGFALQFATQETPTGNQF